MTDKLDQICQLLSLLDIAFQAEQLKMGKIKNRINLLKLQMMEIDKPMRVAALSAANLAGADLRWDAWVHDRKLLINQELAHAFRDREAARGEMIKALSKREAAKQMYNRAKANADQVAKSRASW